MKANVEGEKGQQAAEQLKVTKAALNCITNIYSKEIESRPISSTVSSAAGIQTAVQMPFKALTDNAEATYGRIKELFEFLMRGLQH